MDGVEAAERDGLSPYYISALSAKMSCHLRAFQPSEGLLWAHWHRFAPEAIY